MALRFELITSGKRFLQLDTAVLLHHINSLVREDAYIMTDKLQHRRQEESWKHSMASKIDNGRSFFIVAHEEKKIDGICEVRMGEGHESSVMDFCLSVAPDKRGHGIGFRLLHDGIILGKRKFKPHKVMIRYQGGNLPGEILYRRMGFVEVARLRRHVFHKGKYVDRIFMELDWEKFKEAC